MYGSIKSTLADSLFKIRLFILAISPQYKRSNRSCIHPAMALVFALIYALQPPPSRLCLSLYPTATRRSMSSELFDGQEGPTNTVADSSGTPVPDPDNLIPSISKRRLVLPVLVGFAVFFTYPLRLGLTSSTDLPVASQTGLGLWAATVAFPVLIYLTLELREAFR